MKTFRNYAFVLLLNLVFFGLRMGDKRVSDERKIRTTVDIFGQQYKIIGEENTTHVRMVASMVDDKMREISSKNPYLDTNKLAVLTAVNAMSEFLKLKEELIRYQQISKKEED